MENELIKIKTNENGEQLVSAKELYLGLGLNKATNFISTGHKRIKKHTR